MANDNPNVTGLRPFNQMSRSESAEIQSKGGKASAEKRRAVRRIKDIISDVRAEYEIDPIEQLVVSIFRQALSPTLPLSDMLKVLGTVQKTMGEVNDTTPTESQKAEEFAKLHAQVQKQIAAIKAKNSSLSQRETGQMTAAN